MPGPKTDADALQWAQHAVSNGRYHVSTFHFDERSNQRNLDVGDAEHAIAKATLCEPYPDGVSKKGGTCWRIHGPSIDGDPIFLGVELYSNTKRTRWCTLITIVRE